MANVTYKLKYNFIAESPQELSATEGEAVVGLAPPEEGWVRCRSAVTGREGLVPASFVEKVEAGPARPPPRAPPAVPPAIPSADPFASLSSLSAGLPPKPSPTTRQASQKLAAAVRQPSGGPAAVPHALSSAPYGSATSAYSAPSPSSSFTSSYGKPPAAARGGGYGEIDRGHQDFGENLEKWKVRERRFRKGEVEKLPPLKEREYYYWDRSGNRIGPFTEAQMKARFDSRQIGGETLIAPSMNMVGAMGEDLSSSLPAASIQQYFPNAAAAFATAPLPSADSNVWVYLDDQGQVQGPFPAEQMRTWFEDGYFNAETKAKLAGRQDVEFIELGLLFPEGSGAFLSEGNQAAAVPAYRAPPPAAYAALPPPAIDPAFDPFGLSAPPPPANVFHQRAASGRMLLGMAFDVPPAIPAAASSNNPFELGNGPAAPATQVPQSTQDDWGVMWDDEKGSEEAAADGVAIPDAGEPGARPINYAKFEEVQQRFLSSPSELYKFLTRGLPKELGTVKCRIKRSTQGMMHVNYNYYELFLERDDGTLGPQIATATKHKTLTLESYFDIAIGLAAPSKVGTIISQLNMSTMGERYLLHNNVKGHEGVARDLGAVAYLRGGSGPRKMTAAIPAFQKGSQTEFVTWNHQGGIKKSPFIAAMTSLQFANLQPLMNKPPKWSAKRGAWTLDFKGRVRKASVKNFQLVTPEDHEHVILQHGRVSLDGFTMDMAWPISPVQAFAVCLSSLIGKLGVE